MGIIERARELRVQIEENSTAMTDEAAVQYTELFPKWDGGGIRYTVGQRIRHGDDGLYRVLQEHTSQADWDPESAPSLFAKVLIPDKDAAPEWEQPDSTNPYMKGDRVRHNGSGWVSSIDNNVWEPGVYGWDEI